MVGDAAGGNKPAGCPSNMAMCSTWQSDAGCCCRRCEPTDVCGFGPLFTWWSNSGAIKMTNWDMELSCSLLTWFLMAEVLMHIGSACGDNERQRNDEGRWRSSIVTVMGMFLIPC